MPELSHPRPLRGITDRVGAASSLLCALHCAALPLLLALLPGLSVGLLGSSAFETGFTVVASLLGVSSLALGSRRHGRSDAWWTLWPGLALLWIGAFVPIVHDATVAHAISMALGGALIASAHLRNLRLSLQGLQRAECAACEAH
jgi:integral membrane sensor domain MASE1